MSNREMTAIDLFAGAGGASLGMQMAGFKVVAAVEFDKSAAETFRRNHKDTIMFEKDIRTVVGVELLAAVGLKVGELDYLMGGPPCQGFSFINTQQRSIDDPRSKLMHEFVRLNGEIQPKVFMIENVPGLLSFKDFFILLMETLENQGYVVRCSMMDAVSYGVPQYRKRIFIQGVRKDLGFLPSWPAPTHFDPEVDKKFKNKMFPASSVATKCFATNGFSKEEVRDLYWNDVLHIQMNRKKAAYTLDVAFGQLVGEATIAMAERK